MQINLRERSSFSLAYHQLLLDVGSREQVLESRVNRLQSFIKQCQTCVSKVVDGKDISSEEAPIQLFWGVEYCQRNVKISLNGLKRIFERRKCIWQERSI